jgi:hypothetical protein
VWRAQWRLIVSTLGGMLLGVAPALGVPPWFVRLAIALPLVAVFASGLPPETAPAHALARHCLRSAACLAAGVFLGLALAGADAGHLPLPVVLAVLCTLGLSRLRGGSTPP